MQSIQCSLLFLALVLTQLSFAQQSLFDKAPPHVEEALRARVTLFYQAHVDGKFRLADTVVHEDSKDAFFVADKNQWDNFEIAKIVYKDNYTKADVIVTVETEFFMPGFGKAPSTVPLTTFWKFDEGDWWWYTTPEFQRSRKTPFGIMSAGPDVEESDVASKIKNMPTANDIAAQLAVDRRGVELDCSTGNTEIVRVANGLRGSVYLTLTVPDNPDFTAKLSQDKLGYREKAEISFACSSNEARPRPVHKVYLGVRPMGQRLPIEVAFKPFVPPAKK